MKYSTLFTPLSCPSKVKLGVGEPRLHTYIITKDQTYRQEEKRGGGEGRRKTGLKNYLDSPVKRRAGKCVWVFGVEDHHHYVVGVTFKDLNVLPSLFPIPEFDEHIIRRG